MNPKNQKLLERYTSYPLRDYINRSYHHNLLVQMEWGKIWITGWIGDLPVEQCELINSYIDFLVEKGYVKE